VAESMLVTGGCEHCGITRHSHGQRWAPGVSWHPYAQPTTATIEARMRAVRGLPATPTEEPTP
jgi:hypothetical protein